METIYDVGLYDGADTAYYLESGYRVVAVEANADLVDGARRKFAEQVGSGRLICVHAAVSSDGESVALALSGADMGSSTLFAQRIANKRPIGEVTVPGVRLADLFERHGVPKYLKVDIEGADRFCILALSPAERPDFVSFEAGDDAGELLDHLESIGYGRFKIINQISFRESANVRCLYDRAAHRLMRIMGYAKPKMVRRAGRFFISGHSSGPVPWQSDGRWRTCSDVRARLRSAESHGWNDIHAALGRG